MKLVGDLAVHGALLSAQARMGALGLLPEPRNKGGRPRKSSFRQDMEIALCIGEARRALAGIRRPTQHPELPRVLKQIGRLRRRNALDWRISALSRKADALGRYYQTPILPPEKRKPDIDKIVAKKLGVKPRKVRAIRSDPRFEPFIGPEPWVLRDWEVKERRHYAVRRRAKVLMTPERYAKGERVWLASGGLVVEQCSVWAADYDHAVMLFRLTRRLNRLVGDKETLWDSDYLATVARLIRLIPWYNRSVWLSVRPQWPTMVRPLEED
jgi:hypothetical protein